ncbi:GNAT family N-acetyltransferase [Noviherbaspirillum sp.]|uniref:GNAT family N-acetyltransferase n=1 Tax=Noviherbaspirillum sp. TaxID=1926288 RepID=UPI002B4679B3|nr:GNAT family N-acetyltransferase [Noviherbaspirillum sp.]HJV82842.1 GNAT family N-acetyltransferase [Noviherbaspirillum sp.]
MDRENINEKVSITLYEQSIPPFIESELTTLYAHIYSSLAQFTVYGNVDPGTYTYVAQINDKTVAVLVFRVKGRMAQVLNEQIWLDTGEVDRFVRYLFDSFPEVDVVSFGALRSDLKRLAYPIQRFYRTEDIVVSLPATEEDYLGMLGKATRKNIKKHSNRIKRSYPSLTCSVYPNDEVTEQHVREVIALNRARMRLKNKVSEIDEDETLRLTRLMQLCGIAFIMRIDGKVVAGSICSRVGGNVFMHISAHNPEYDDFRLGTLCCYLTICEAIRRGARELHFMWGRFDYKYAFLGVRNDYDELTVYRSRVAMLRHARSALKIAFEGHRRALKFRLLDIADRQEHDNAGARWVSRILNAVRDLKQTRFGPIADGS